MQVTTFVGGPVGMVTNAAALVVAALVVTVLGIPSPATPSPAPEHTRVAASSYTAEVAKGPKLTVDVKKGRHRISPLVYGVNFWYFTNFADCWSEAFAFCQRGQDFSAADAQVQQDRTTHTATLLTLPATGWVANAVSYTGSHPCSYPASVFDPQEGRDPYHSVCGNGRRNGQWAGDADPGAATLGPAEWGWPNYFCSAADHVEQGCFPTSRDRATHGGTELSAWYLQQFARYEQQTGQRLLDYFDLHYYPQATYAGHTYSPVTDVTRPLWDTGYTDPSWIDAKIGLIPRMREWVRTAYPGTRLGISEFNLGLGVTSAPRLQNVIEAAPSASSAARGSTSRRSGPRRARRSRRRRSGSSATTTGTTTASATAASRPEAPTSDGSRCTPPQMTLAGKRGPLTIVVVNKATTALRTAVRLRHAHGAGRVKAYQYAGAAIRGLGRVRVRHHAVRLALPPESVTLIRVPLRS